MRRWVHDEGWASLHDVQVRAVEPILAGGRDVILAATTAAGKTEAAFLPIVSALAADTPAAGARGVQVLYISPLKALINDQFGRLRDLCGRAEVPVWRWHGDVAGHTKQKMLADPAGVLLITPESLEALFVNRGSEMRATFGGLRWIVIDELHSFLATPRGAQLQSLIARVELVVRRKVGRVGLSATLGDVAQAASFLRPDDPDHVTVVDSSGEGSPLLLQLRGYVAPSEVARKAAAKAGAATGLDSTAAIDAEEGDMPEIADHLFTHLRGRDNLIFANARRDVETYADLLARRCDTYRVPNEFWAHHGNLSKDMRETVEDHLRSGEAPATAVCTSTLELGIDVGSVSSIAQVGPPPSVAALRQRVGRSGRRGEPSVLRLYVTEKHPGDIEGPVDRLRCLVVRTTAMVRLMLDRWLESADDPGFNYSTLIQQTLSVIAQHGGATAEDLYGVLCGPGPFRLVDRDRYVALLQCMAKADLVMQTSEGLLLPGGEGERQVNHYGFYAAFHTGDEWGLVAAGRRLGSLPVAEPLRVGKRLLFGGKSWRIVAVDPRARVVQLERSAGGAAIRFGGTPAAVSGRVREEMLAVLASGDVPSWLDAGARELLAEGRAAFQRFRLAATSVVAQGGDVWLFPWAGDRALYTAMILLVDEGFDCGVEGPALRLIGASVGDVADSVRDTLGREWPPAAELAESVHNQNIDKWDWVLNRRLSCEAAAARLLDVDGARGVLSKAVPHLEDAVASDE